MSFCNEAGLPSSSGSFSPERFALGVPRGGLAASDGRLEFLQHLAGVGLGGRPLDLRSFLPALRNIAKLVAGATPRGSISRSTPTSTSPWPSGTSPALSCRLTERGGPPGLRFHSARSAPRRAELTELQSVQRIVRQNEITEEIIELAAGETASRTAGRK